MCWAVFELSRAGLLWRRVPGPCRSTDGGDFNSRSDAQAFGDAPGDCAQVFGGRVSIAVEHPMQRFFVKAGLPCEFFEAEFGVDRVAQSGKRPGCVAL